MKLLLLTLCVSLITLLSGCQKEPGISLAYFYLEVCPGCESYIKAEALSNTVAELVKSGRYEGRSWNMGHASEESGDILMKMIEERNLPDISYALPLLFVGDDYYVGYEDIESTLSRLQEELTKE